MPTRTFLSHGIKERCPSLFLGADLFPVLSKSECLPVLGEGERYSALCNVVGSARTQSGVYLLLVVLGSVP